MYAVFLTAATLLGAGGGPYQIEEVGPLAASCDHCAAASGHAGHGLRGACHAWCGPMPQSCYNPTLGCYASTRFMNRYPALHGTYYRAAYNYRNYFDYPWHAGLHEPTSHFSYNVPGALGETILPPAPLPAVGDGGH